MIIADLHVHTTNSDGQLATGEVTAAATTAGVDAVAITDHDRLNPELETPVARLDGVTVIHGLELRVETGDERVDLLGYGMTPTDAFRTELDRLQDDRIERASAIVEWIEDYTGQSLDFDSVPGVGRPHIARAVENSAIEYDYQGAFEHLIGDDCPCYVPRQIPSFERGLELLRGSCGLVSLAHPLRYADPEAALSLTTDLDGVEYHYDYDREVNLRSVERAVSEHDLVVTGGSDAHDRTLGRAGLNREEYREFRNSMNI